MGHNPNGARIAIFVVHSYAESFPVEALKKGTHLGNLMAMKVLKNEGGELRIRISGEDHTTLHVFRTHLNAHKDVDYCNYFSGHPDLDDPELYIRANKGKDPVKILKSVVKDAGKAFSSLSL